MKKFLKIELGSRGEVENVEVVNTAIELIEDEYDDKYSDLSKDSDEIPYLEEFSSIEIKEDIGVVMYGFSEEDTTYYIDFDKNEDICKKVLIGWTDKSQDNLLFYAIEDMYLKLSL